MSDHEYIYGYHAVHALIFQHAKSVQGLFLHKQSVDSERMQGLIALAAERGVSVDYVSRDKLADCLPPGVTHQGVVALAAAGISYDEHYLQELVTTMSGPLLLLILDEVQDPHNLGASLRVANAHGVDAVIIPQHNAVGLTPVVRKVACGAAEATPLIQVTNIARAMQQLKQAGVWLVGLDADQKAMPLFDVDLKGRTAFVMGGEGKGMRRLTRTNCDFLSYIPMCGTVSSLNVATATAIALYEACRQRS